MVKGLWSQAMGSVLSPAGTLGSPLLALQTVG